MGNDKSQWGSIAANVAGSTASTTLGTAMGLIWAGANDRRQLRQQEKLNELQMKGNKEMVDYNMMKELEMWKNTGYSAQVEQMKKAGINPGLLYGMGGGGGQSMGSPGGAGVTGGAAPSGGGEIGMGMQNMMQLKLLEAQKANIEASTEKTIAEKENLPLTGENIVAGTKGQNLQNRYLENSMTDRLSKINSEATVEVQKAQQMVNDTNVSDNTIQDRIKQIKQRAIGEVLDNALTKATIGKTGEEIKRIKAEIGAIAAYVEQGWQRTKQGQSQIQQGWDKINVDRNRNEIMERLGNAGLDLQDRGQILQTISGVMGMGANQMPRETHNSWWTEDGQGNWQQGHSTQKR